MAGDGDPMWNGGQYTVPYELSSSSNAFLIKAQDFTNNVFSSILKAPKRRIQAFLVVTVLR